MPNPDPLHIVVDELSRMTPFRVTVDTQMPSGFAALVAAVITVLGSVFVATYNKRMAHERVAKEANRAEKAAAYKVFTDMLLDAFQTAGGRAIPMERLTESVLSFVGSAMIYGNPGVILAMQNWRANTDQRTILLAVDELLQAIRADLGESNKGLKQLDLVGLFIVGGRPAILKALKDMPPGE